MRNLLSRAIFTIAFYLASAAEKNSGKEKPITRIRPILADQLRDSPGLCFASTKCATVEIGSSWDLAPYCGRSTCAKAEDGRLIEVIEECAPAPNPYCTLQEIKRRKSSRSENSDKRATFPDCCPIYNCPEESPEEENEEERKPTEIEAEEKEVQQGAFQDGDIKKELISKQEGAEDETTKRPRSRGRGRSGRRDRGQE